MTVSDSEIRRVPDNWRAASLKAGSRFGGAACGALTLTNGIAMSANLALIAKAPPGGAVRWATGVFGVGAALAAAGGLMAWQVYQKNATIAASATEYPGQGPDNSLILTLIAVVATVVGAVLDAVGL